MTIGQTIQERRQALGMTQEELAAAVYVTAQAVSQWEHDKTLPDIMNLAPIAQVLKINKADLLGEVDYSRPEWVVRDSFYAPDRMYRKLKQFAIIESLEQTDRAIDFALEAHEGQFRKRSIFSDEQVPYIVHPLTMACHAHALNIHDDVVLATCLLHDVSEDCGIACDTLPFSPEVCAAVSLLTKPADRSTFSEETYYARIAQNSTAAIVKVLDRCNNIATFMASFELPDAIAYINETEQYVIPLLNEIKRRYQQYYDATFVLKYQIYSVIETVKATVLRF